MMVQCIEGRLNKMERDMVMESRSGLIVLSMKEIGEKILDKEEVDLLTKKEMYMMVRTKIQI